MARNGVLDARKIKKQKLSPEEIVARVERHADITDGLRKRQDEDFDLWWGRPFEANDDETTEYASYTSNEPATYAEKMTSLLSTAEVPPRVPHLLATRAEREQYDNKERLTRGMFAAGDEKLIARLKPELLPQLSWYVPIRGWYAVRAMLINVEMPDGELRTEVDITPFDPRNVYWGMGPTGVEWVCNKTWMTSDEVLAEWGVDLEIEDATHTVAVYDYYTQSHNTVVTGQKTLKKPTEHGMTDQVPIALGMVGLAPFIVHNDGAEWGLFGESIYHSNREVYKHKNEILSIYLELLNKSRDPAWMFKTQGGTGELEATPNEPGNVHKADTTDQLEMVQIPEVTKTVEQMLAVVSGESQRGSLPYSVYGELAFQLSGFAINSLNTTMRTTLHPFARAIERAFNQIANMLIKQYVSRRFETFEVQGFDGQAKFFKEKFEREDVDGLPPIVHKLTADIPQNDAEKFALAERAQSFMALPQILEDILEVDDVDATIDALKAQFAESSHPLAQAYSMMIAAERRDEPNIAAIWFGVLQTMLRDMLQQTGGAPTPSGGAPKAGELDPRILSSPQQDGGVPPTPTPQAGPNVPPGSPRPGAEGNVLSRLLGSLTGRGG